MDDSLAYPEFFLISEELYTLIKNMKNTEPGYVEKNYRDFNNSYDAYSTPRPRIENQKKSVIGIVKETRGKMNYIVKINNKKKKLMKGFLCRF